MENDNSTIVVTEKLESVYIITFILLLIVEIPSLFCTTFILLFFIFNWYALMIKVLHNHAIFLLMIISMLYITLDLPFIMSYYHLSYDRFRTRTFCLWWYWFDYTLAVTSLFLTAIASIQRHILVFHTRWLHGSRKRWILHYIPLIFCLIYPAIFYFIFILFFSCETPFDEDGLYCPFPCYSDDWVLFYVDWVFNIILPVTIIVLTNVALICRVIYSLEQFRHSQSRIWKKRRKLTLQLLAFSTLYAVGWAPSTVISIIHTFLLPSLYDTAPDLYYINNSSYFVCPLQPFICFFALPELLKLIKKKVKRRSAVTTIPASVIGDTRI